MPPDGDTFVYKLHSSPSRRLIACHIEYIVQPYRFDLVEDIGPMLVVVLQYPSIPLFYLWPIVIGMVSLFYCGAYLAVCIRPVAHLSTVMTIYHFYKRGRQFSQVMSSNRGLNQSRYFRLMCLSMIEIFGTIPLASWVLSLNAKAGFVPWVGFAALHQDFDLIYQIPSVVWKNYHISHVLFEFYRWSLVACAFTFFGFFGFADEARRHYRLVYTSLASRVGLSTSNGKFAGSSHGYVRSLLPELVVVLTVR